MKKNRATYIKESLIPCLGLSMIAGILTGALIFLFKLACTAVIRLSTQIYDAVRANPIYLPLLILGAAVIGLLAALILKYEPSSRGGGIPTAIAILRGVISFHWLKNLLALFSSAMLTYLCAVPLGTEGPSVQMGTALGKGTVRIFAKKNLAWERYIMTGGACAGFASATGAPLSGIFFAFEEAHRRFSPMIFLSAATAVFSGYAVSEHLCSLVGMQSKLFHLNLIPTLPIRYIWIAIVIGIISGVIGIVLTKAYQYFKKLNEKAFLKKALWIKIPIIFVATALIGFASSNLIGTGHSLIENLFEGNGIWYLLLLYLAVRALLLILSTTSGVTGGLFIPSLAFGALIGALIANVLIALELMPREYYILAVTIGMTSFLSAFSRTPITAIAFAIEALGGFSNMLPMIAGVTFAYLTIEVAAVTAFSEAVVESKEEKENKGKTATIIDEHVTVHNGAFAVDKEIRDILWPPTCTVLSVERNPIYSAIGDSTIHPGDVLHLHYRTYDTVKSRTLIESIVGTQTADSDAKTHVADKNHQVPQL